MRSFIDLVQPLLESSLPDNLPLVEVDGRTIVSPDAPLWVQAYHGTIQNFDEPDATRGDAGFFWATPSRKLASNFALRTIYNGARVMLLQIDISGFLFVNGQYEEIRSLDTEPCNYVKQNGLPGVLFHRVRDEIPYNYYTGIDDVLAILDTRRVKGSM